MKRGKPFTKWPSVGSPYGVPKHAPKNSMRWSEPNLIEFIKTKQDWDYKQIADYLRITPEHAKYLVLRSRQDQFKAWLKE